MRPAPTRLPLAQYTNAGRLPASSRTAATKLVNVASLTAPCPIGMLRYSSPAATTASGVRNGRGSIGSRMSITTAQPARFSAARCSSAGCPPVTTPGMGSEALGTPAMASSSWLIGRTAASFPHTIYPHVARHDVASPSLAARPLEAAPQAVAQLGRCVPHGAALPTVSRCRGSHRNHPGGGPRGRVELPYLPEPHPGNGAGARRQGARPLEARGGAPERRGIPEDPAPIGTILPIGRARASLPACARAR